MARRFNPRPLSKICLAVIWSALGSKRPLLAVDKGAFRFKHPLLAADKGPAELLVILFKSICITATSHYHIMACYSILSVLMCFSYSPPTLPATDPHQSQCISWLSGGWGGQQYACICDCQPEQPAASGMPEEQQRTSLLWSPIQLSGWINTVEWLMQYILCWGYMHVS